MSEAIYKLQPHRPQVYLSGVDNRGADAAWVNTSSSGGTVQGDFNDQVDFAVLRIIDADTPYAHILNTRPLPDFNLTGVVLDTDVALTNCFSPTSVKFDSLNAAQLSYITETGTPGTKPLAWSMTSTTGGAVASAAITIGGTIASGDVFQVVYLGNYQFTYTAASGDTASNVASGLAKAINLGAAAGLSITLFAIASGATVTIYAGRSAAASGFTLSSANLSVSSTANPPNGFWGAQSGDPVIFINGSTVESHTVSSLANAWEIALDSAPSLSSPTLAMWPLYQADGNSVAVQASTTSVAGTMTPNGCVKLTGGASESKLHLKIDFSGLGITSLRQVWLTFGPVLKLDSSGSDQTVQPFAKTTFSAEFSNWTVTDPSSNTALKVAGPGSVLQSSWDTFGGGVAFAGSGWTRTSGGDQYFRGFCQASSHSGDTVAIEYTCNETHDVLIGSAIANGQGTLHVTLDGVSQADLVLSDSSVPASTPLITRRAIATGVSAGSHTVVLTVASGGGQCIFDYLQAAVRSDVPDPEEWLTNVCPALDYDNLAFSLSPEAVMWLLEKFGYAGDLYVYEGVFFSRKRTRSGGNFHSATVALSGSLVVADAVFLSISGVTGGLGVAVTASDTLTSIAQRFVNAINTLFVGVYAAPTSTAGQFTITVLSPLNGFSLSSTSGAHLTISVSGDIGYELTSGSYVGGQEGVWQADFTQSSPVNSALAAWLSGIAAIVAVNATNKSASPAVITGPPTMCVAVSDEIFAPPDANTSSGASVQRFADGTPVLTATGFGDMGAGYVESVSTSAGVTTIKQTGHGYIPGNTAHFASPSALGVWQVATVADANHYTIVDADYIANSTGSYVPGAGDTVYIELQTCQMTFNPSTTTAYMENAYVQIANLLAAAGVDPVLVFGEIGWWFFSEYSGIPISGVSNSSGLVEFETSSPHGLTNGQTAIVCGAPAGNGTAAVTVIDATHFTNGAAWPGGSPAASGTVSGGGGMALYDAYTDAQAVSNLSRSLATFYTQDDDPSVNSHADANLLRTLLYDHMHSIASAVAAAQPTAKLKWLAPMDVWGSPVYSNGIYPYPQGGRLNNYINLPAQYEASGSDVSSLILECLSFGDGYRSIDQVKAAFAQTASEMSWADSDIQYLFPWLNAGCPWQAEAFYALRSVEGLAGLIPFAIDHQISMSLNVAALANLAGLSAAASIN